MRAGRDQANRATRPALSSRADNSGAVFFAQPERRFALSVIRRPGALTRTALRAAHAARDKSV
jgi:hypothetical protein